MNGLSRPHLLGLVAGLCLAAGLVVSSMLATTTWLKVRNSQFVTVKGSARKNIKNADMGVIQIAPIHSGETTWDGMNDKSSLDKTITAVITASFALK